MQSLSHFHLGAAKRVLRYVQGTTDLGLNDMKSTSGYCFSFGSTMISWLSKKQQSVAQSSAEAEYVSASLATSQTIWLRRILADLGHHQDEGTVLIMMYLNTISKAQKVERRMEALKLGEGITGKEDFRSWRRNGE
ncbi:hypothetical protein ZIOFF_049165 [Zingiber officinale]|uniref:Uncharacterized protein n=1 Tax=Zingiber officinale TaxID=94328 RepID=A0A8J5KN68_ZINOF|nr:hypothetical protein ZIOFF_049165 [Zingiber officinale]